MKEMTREYRNMPIEGFELRAAEEEQSYNVRGYASTFEEYELFQDGENHYCERIEPTAFEGCDMSDVVFRKDHTGTVFARTSNGALKLDVDAHGLLTDTDLSRTASAREMHEEIRAGMYTQMSFAFVVSDDEIIKDKEHHNQTNKYDDENNVIQAVVVSKDIALWTNDGHAPTRRAKWLIEHIALVSLEHKLTHTRFAMLHGMTKGGKGCIGMFECRRKNGLVEQLGRIRMNKESSTMSDHDTI